MKTIGSIAVWVRRHIVHGAAIALGMVATELIRELVTPLSSLGGRVLVDLGATVLAAAGGVWAAALRQHGDLPVLLGEAAFALVMTAASIALLLVCQRTNAENRTLRDAMERESQFKLAMVAMEAMWKWTLAVETALARDARKAALISRVLDACDELLRVPLRGSLRIAYVECRDGRRAVQIPVPDARMGSPPTYQLVMMGTPVRMDESGELNFQSFKSDRGMVNDAILHGEQRYCPDVTRTDLQECGCYVQTRGGLRFRSLVCQPVVWRHMVRGAMCVDSGVTDAFVESDLKMIEHLSAKIGLVYAMLDDQ